MNTARLRSQEALTLERILAESKHRYLFCWNGEQSEESYDCACCMTYLTDELLCDCGCVCHERIDSLARGNSTALWLRAMAGMQALPPFFSSEEEKVAYLEGHRHNSGCECEDCLFLSRVKARKEQEKRIDKDEYREHMRTYSRDTAVMSFVVYKHPDFQALQAAGDEIIPWLLDDLLDREWHCNLCYGFGTEFVPRWQEARDKGDKTWPPKSTGNRCPQCRGKGNICSWAAMHLLFEKTRARGDAPVVEDWMRGKHDALAKLWRKWGERKGYLPVNPDTFFGTIRRAMSGLLKLWVG